jgi:hypothetical protein
VPELWTLGDIKRVKILRIILVISEVLFLVLLIFPPVVESRPFANAIVAYHENPSPQTKSELEHQQEIVRGMRFHQSLFIAGLLAVNSVGLFYVLRRIQGRVVA